MNINRVRMFNQCNHSAPGRTVQRAALAALALGLMASTASAVPSESSVNAAGGDLFERAVRPLLAQHCYQCHGQDEQAGGLRLDSRQAMLRGGAAGRPAITPGRPELSPLLSVAEAAGQDEPHHRLNEKQRRSLRQWIRLGARWPGSQDTPARAPIRDEQGRAEMKRALDNHWAFQPIRRPALPEVRNEQWAHNPIDLFILDRLEAAGLTPSEPAERSTLMRRAALDLVGLTPDYEAVQRFVNDDSPDAFSKVVNRLLDSPRYGERWGRYWLDVARYADSKGYLAGGRERKYPYAYTYRDYVIRAFNEDKPFDRFILEQIAADKLDLEGEDKEALAAMGFLTVGPRFNGNIHDITDDRIDAITRGFMGLAVACARCHDHKYDPIPTEDYYSLYGVLRSATEPDAAQLPVIREPTPSPEYNAYKEELAKRKQAIEDYKAKAYETIQRELRANVGDYLRYIANTMPKHKRGDVKRQNRRRGGIRAWQAYLKRQTDKNHPIFGLWHRLAALEPAGFAKQARQAIEGLNAEGSDGKQVNPLVLEALRNNPPASMADVAKAYGRVFKQIDQRWQEARKSSNGKAKKLDNPDAEALRRVLYTRGGPATFQPEQVERFFERKEHGKVRGLRAKVDELRVNSPAAPPRAMVMRDRNNPFNPRVFKRGNAGSRGDRVPRRFLQLLESVDGGKTYKDGSGRLQLAKAIASPDNPLTARVMVNRIWMHHFGKPLVPSPSDFGVRSEPPSHPRLLNWLAAEFINSGWSVKHMHRLIMGSAAYQQASRDRSAGREVDPENELLWRMNRQRLEFEPLRDSLLKAANRLNNAIGGRPVQAFSEPFTPRRSIYGRIERQFMPDVLRTFDFAGPDSSKGRRPQTTVPQQALFLMNSPFVVQQVRHIAARPDVQQRETLESRVQRLYQLLFSRSPEPGEIDLARRFIEQQKQSERFVPEKIWRYGYGRYDAEQERTASFTELPHFGGDRWQGGKEYPAENKLRYTSLTAKGGHAGPGQQHMTIRRWTSPISATVEINALLRHDHKEGNGVRARIVSSRAGQLGEWTVHNSRKQTGARVRVEPGDTIDFVIDSRGDTGWDSFHWAPTIRPVGPDAPAATRNWRAETDFAGPNEQSPAEPLSAWQRYVQALVMTNEFMFAD